jgi:sugar phosphate isomerase/epimerase
LGLPIGSQTYPHRQMIVDGKFPELLKTLKDIGVDRIELCSAIGYKEFMSLADAKQTKKIISDHGLKCESAHFSMPELRNSQDKSIAWAKEIGITQMITATLSGPVKDGVAMMDDVKKAADEYNKIGAVAAKAGIQQGLHNEGFELAMVDGKRVYDVLFELLDPKLVKFQFQMSTITSGLVGADYFTKYPGRFISMHVQDIDMNAPVPPPPPPDPNAAPGRGRGGRGGRPQKAVGQGTIDWVKTFTAAKKAGVKNYFVEQNMDLTKESVAALKAMKV